MSTKICQHCNAPVPEAFASMPVCSICGGDLNAPSENSGWSSIAINSQNIRTCDSCGSEISSVFITECPECGKHLIPAGSKVEEKEIQEIMSPPTLEEIRKEEEIEKEKIQEAITASQIEAIRKEEIVQKPIEEIRKEEPIQEEVKEIKKEFVPPSVVKKEETEKTLEETSKLEEKKENFFIKLLRKLGFKI